MKKFILFSLLFLLIFSCRKDQNSCKKIIDSASNLTIGTTETTLITPLNLEMSAELNTPNFIILDVNSDGISDYKFSFENKPTPPPAQELSKGIKFQCLHENAFVLADTSPDSVFYGDYTVYSGTEPVITSNIHYQGCERKTADFEVIDIKTNEGCEFLNATDQISKSNNWHSINSYFYKTVYTSENYLESENADTMFYKTSIIESHCDDTPPSGINYLPIKMNFCDTEKLGWIKFEITNNTTIKVYEYALQK